MYIFPFGEGDVVYMRDVTAVRRYTLTLTHRIHSVIITWRCEQGPRGEKQIWRHLLMEKQTWRHLLMCTTDNNWNRVITGDIS